MDLVKLTSEFKLLLVELECRQIHTQKDLDWAASWLTQIAAAYKHVETKRTSEKAPHLASCKAVDSRYKPAAKALEACEAILKSKIAALRARQRQAEEVAREAVRATGGQADGDTLALAHGAGAFVLPDQVRETSNLEWEVLDESAVPIEYKRTCAELVEAEIERTRGACKIPGVRVWREFGVARKGVVRR